MASATASIPRFLLPQSGLIWRRAAAATAPSSASSGPGPGGRIFLRLASTSKPNAPSGAGRVLAKPERFNPPSHGTRLPKKGIPRHYGGDLSAAEVKAQTVREYPGMPPPKHTRAHWFLHNRWIHVVITVSTLTTLAIFTFTLSFKQTSPFADMLPPASDFLYHPIDSGRMLVEVLRLHEAHKTARINDKRRRNVEDVAKRAAYRKAHGLPDEMGLFNQPMAKIRTEGEGDDASPVAAAAAAASAAVVVGEGQGADAAAAAAGAGEGAAAMPASEGKGDKGPEVRRLSEEERQAVVEKAKGKWLGIF